MWGWIWCADGILYCLTPQCIQQNHFLASLKLLQWCRHNYRITSQRRRLQNYLLRQVILLAHKHSHLPTLCYLGWKKSGHIQQMVLICRVFNAKKFTEFVAQNFCAELFNLQRVDNSVQLDLYKIDIYKIVTLLRYLHAIVNSSGRSLWNFLHSKLCI